MYHKNIRHYIRELTYSRANISYWLYTYVRDPPQPPLFQSACHYIIGEIVGKYLSSEEIYSFMNCARFFGPGHNIWVVFDPPLYLGSTQLLHLLRSRPPK